MTEDERIPTAVRIIKGTRLDTKAAIAKERDNRLRRACLPVCWDCAQLNHCGMDAIRACGRVAGIVEKFEKENGENARQ